MTLPAYQGDVGLCTPCPRCDRPGSQNVRHHVTASMVAVELMCIWGHSRSATDAELEEIKDLGIRLVGASSNEQSKRRKHAEQWGESLTDPAVLREVISRAVGEDTP